MASLTLTVVGFLVATAVVIALARTSTARWERARRAAQAPRREVVTRRRTRAGTGRPPGPVVRKIVGTVRSPASLAAPLKVGAALLVTAPKQVASRVLRSSPHDGGPRKAGPAGTGSPVTPAHDEGDVAVPSLPKRARGARAVGRVDGPGVVGRRLFRRAPRVPRRSARRFLGRRDPAADPHVLHGDTDDSPTAL